MNIKKMAELVIDHKKRYNKSLPSAIRHIVAAHSHELDAEDTTDERSLFWRLVAECDELEKNEPKRGLIAERVGRSGVYRAANGWQRERDD